MMRFCSKCQLSFPMTTEYFARRKRDALGFMHTCKSCVNEHCAKYRKEHKEKVVAHTRAWRANHPEKVIARRKQYREKNPKKARAHNAIKHAIAKGKIISMPCFCCGETAEAHHPDYDRPLDVVWLCKAHHRAAHNLLSKYADIHARAEA